MHTHQPAGPRGVLVDTPVAVVVLAVAGLRRQLAAVATRIQHALVNMTIAVVVGLVADLVDPGHLGDAALRAVNTLEDPDAAGVSFSAGGPDVRGRLVDHAITVVIDAIAELGARRGARTSREHARDAGRSTRPADAETRRVAGDHLAVHARVREAFVDSPIAVVILPIRHLVRARRDGRAADDHERVGRAGEGADRAAISDARLAWQSDRLKPLVHASVTVVVERVAALGALRRHPRRVVVAVPSAPCDAVAVQVGAGVDGHRR
jgi:hypothetical protein